MNLRMNRIQFKKEIALITMVILTFFLISVRSLAMANHLLILFVLIFSRSFLLRNIRPKNKLSHDRKKWLFSVINNILEVEEYSSVFLEYEIAKELNLTSSFEYEIELAIQIEQEKTMPNIPDLIQAERELLEIEYRASSLLILLITIPLIYLIFHSIYQTGLIFALLRLLILILIIEIATVNSRNPYRLNQWSEGLKLVRANRQNLIHEPLRSMGNFEALYDNITSFELSMEPQISKYNEASTDTIALLILILTKIDQFVRQPLIDEFLHVTRDLPQYEEIHKIKWKVFSNQFIIIAIISTFFTAILSSITTISAELGNLYIGDNSTSFIFLPTPRIGELTVLLSIFLGSLFSKNYFPQKVQLIISGTLIAVGVFVYYSIIVLFSFLMN